MAATIAESIEGTPAPDVSPFLPSDPVQFPNIAKIDVPDAAKAEFVQQMELVKVDLPFERFRANTLFKQWKPCCNCPPSFKFAFNAFCSARRVVAASTIMEGEALLASETNELVAHAKGENGAFGSLPPRGLSMSLVVQDSERRSMSATSLLDGFAAMSDARTSDGLPATTLIRYSVYGGSASGPIERVLSKDSFDRKTVEGVSLVVRWVELAEGDREARLRTECFSPGFVPSAVHEIPALLQKAVVEMAVEFGFKLPSVCFTPPPESKECYFERQVSRCSRDLQSLIHTHQPPPEGLGNTKLVRVPGCFVRLSPVAMELKGVTSPSVLHGWLLCEEGFEQQACEYARRHREGMPVPTGVESLMRLHTAAAHTEKLFMNGMVSLYAPGGKQGQAIHSDGNWVYRTNAAVVPLEYLQGSFFVMSCGLESLMPNNIAFGKFMHTHMQRSMDLVDRMFGTDGNRPHHEHSFTRTRPPPSPSSQDRLSMAAFGLDLTCKRLLVGEALAYLTAVGCDSGLVDVLMAACTRLGLSASVSDAFSGCALAMKVERDTETQALQDMWGLKRVADAALLIGFNKRARLSNRRVPAAKVRLLLKALNLKSGHFTVKVEDFVSIPRCADVCRSLWKSVCECVDVQDSAVHLQDSAMALLSVYSDLFAALARVLHSTLVFKDDDAKVCNKTAFIIVHGAGFQEASINRVSASGELQASDAGTVFEADAPSVLLVKLTSDRACLVSPLVTR